MDSSWKIAVIGSGPAGFYAAGELFRQKSLSIKVDMFERLPTPFGLVRGGVAPDHQKIKSVTKIYSRIAENANAIFSTASLRSCPSFSCIISLSSSDNFEII